MVVLAILESDMEAYIKTNKQYTLTLSLSPEELKCLHNMMQNPISMEESKVEEEVRLKLYNATDVIG